MRFWSRQPALDAVRRIRRDLRPQRPSFKIKGVKGNRNRLSSEDVQRIRSPSGKMSFCRTCRERENRFRNSSNRELS